MNTSLYRPCDNARVECLRLGKEQEPLILVDNFMQGADRLKSLAIEKNKFDPATNYYPGVRMPAPKTYPLEVLKALGGLIYKVFAIDPRKLTGAHAFYSIVTRQPQELSLLQKVPHFDAPTKKSLAAIHYLTEDPNSGTALYRHIQSGYEFIDKQRMNTYFEQVQQQFKLKTPKGYICGSTEEYEQIASFSANYNRFVMYRASSLHSGIIPANHNFDPDPATGRLTITSFLHFS